MSPPTKIPSREQLRETCRVNSIKKTAEVYGVHPQTIVNWRRKYNLKKGEI